MIMIISPTNKTTLIRDRVILSKSSKYAIRAVLYLAEQGGDAPVPVDEIARRLDVPRNYLSKVLHILGGTEVLDSTRGPGGGFRLAVPASELRLSEIVEHFDDIPDETTCLLGRGRCSEIDPCRAHARWASVRMAITGFLDRTRLTDLSNEEVPEAVADVRLETR